MPAVNDVGKPYAGEPHARFNGRELETEQRSGQGHEVKDPRGNPAVTGGSRPTVDPRHRASSRPYPGLLRRGPARPPGEAGVATADQRDVEVVVRGHRVAAFPSRFRVL